jgi:exosortase
MNERSPHISQVRPVHFIAFGGLALGVLWAYWPTLVAMGERWSRDPLYSHGYFVPVFSLVFLWLRRRELASAPKRSTWWGVAFLFAGLLLRFTGAYFYFPWFDGISLLFCLTGLCLFLFGRKVFAVSWPAIAFLVFMLPLPYRLEVGMRQPLQKVATWGSTYALQTLGCSAFSEGNIITVNRTRMGVEDACSGLGMLLVFFALSTALAIFIKKPLWERILIFLSAFPIAIIANIIRITGTGVLYQMGQSATAQFVFHELAGWLMMPLALILLWIEMAILSRLLVVTDQARPSPLGLAGLSSGAFPVPNGKSSRRRGRGKNPRSTNLEYS